jgi:hypothetical protein
VIHEIQVERRYGACRRQVSPHIDEHLAPLIGRHPNRHPWTVVKETLAESVIVLANRRIPRLSLKPPRPRDIGGCTPEE